MLPKLILTDIDGVWTDGGMYYDDLGNELKKFNTYDSAGILFCKILKIPCGIITGEDVNSVKRRAEKLDIKLSYFGIKNKVEVVESLLHELSIKWCDVAFIGDDINDYNLLKKVGLSACPSSAPEYIKKIVNWELSKKGGEGVFREFVEKIISDSDLDIEIIIKEYLNMSSSFNQ